MPEPRAAGAEAAAVRSDISAGMRDRYLAYRRTQAELRAWLELSRSEEPGIERQLRSREGSALDELIKAPAASLADLAVKLEVLRELSAGELPMPTPKLFETLAGDSLRLTGSSEIEGRVLALRLTLTLLLNAAAVDQQSLERTRQAVLELIDRPDSPCAADANVSEAAREEVSALFSWIE